MTSARSVRLRVLPAVALAAVLVAGAGVVRAEGPTPLSGFQTPQALLTAMITQEQESAAKHDRYEYVSKERSERTGGHLWTERVVETGTGKIRLLLAEDGRPLSAERAEQERERLADIVAHPEEVERKEEALKG